jgi:hypothetical protein
MPCRRSSKAAIFDTGHRTPPCIFHNSYPTHTRLLNAQKTINVTQKSSGVPMTRFLIVLLEFFFEQLVLSVVVLTRSDEKFLARMAGIWWRTSDIGLCSTIHATAHFDAN